MAKIDREYPRFISETDECIWCGVYAKLQSVYANEEENVVEATYECKNQRCEHLKFFKKPHVCKMIHMGKNCVATLKQYRKKSESQNAGQA